MGPLLDATNGLDAHGLKGRRLDALGHVAHGLVCRRLDAHGFASHGLAAFGLAAFGLAGPHHELSPPSRLENTPTPCGTGWA